MGYSKHIIAWYDLSTINPPNLSPIRPGQYDGTGVNLVAGDVVDGIAGGSCLRLDGLTKHVIIGDVLELNAVSAFTIAFWMNQDVAAQTDIIFAKASDATHYLRVQTFGGLMYFRIRDGLNTYGTIPYDALAGAGSWHHIAMVFDGGQTGDANRLVAYLDGTPRTLTFAGPIPAATPNMPVADASLGLASDSFDGKLDEFVILTQPLTQIQVNDLMIRQRQGTL